MLKEIRLIVFVLLCCVSSKGQLIQGTIKPGATVDEFEIWLKPDFTNSSTQYLFQIGLPIAFPAAASPQPTGINVVLDASFVTNFGSNYSVTVNPVATATGGTEKYFNIVLIRGGAGASLAQTWSTAEFKVLTGTFTYSSGATTFLAKLADYQDGGSDGLGNFYTQSGNNDYYITSNSVGNFYASASNSQVGGTASAGYAQLLSGALPVNLINFSGYKSEDKNVLKWTTAIEINNKGFGIQRSTNGYDYQRIGFVNSLASGGNSSSLLHYSFEDNTPVGVQQYYRLQQEDLDGRSKLSPVVVIRGENPSALSFEAVFPNPANEQVNIRLNAPGRDQLTLLVIDGNGQQVLVKEVIIEAGSNTISVDVTKLARGNYLMKLVCKEGCEKLVQRLMKQ